MKITTRGCPIKSWRIVMCPPRATENVLLRQCTGVTQIPCIFFLDELLVRILSITVYPPLYDIWNISIVSVPLKGLSQKHCWEGSTLVKSLNSRHEPVICLGIVQWKRTRVSQVPPKDTFDVIFLKLVLVPQASCNFHVTCLKPRFLTQPPPLLHLSPTPLLLQSV